MTMHRSGPWLVLTTLSLLLGACGAPSHAPSHVAGEAWGSPPSLATAAPVGEGSPSPGGHLRVKFLDVGQGDSTLLTTDDGASMLLDLGPKEGNARLRHAVDGLGGTVRVVLVTHAHADHLGELDELARDVQVGAFWDSGFAEHPTKTYPRALSIFETKHVPHVVARKGMHLRLGAHTDVEVLAPRDPLLANTRSDPNANSVVVRVTHAGTSPERTVRFLFTGDAEAPTEARLLESPDTLTANVLKVAHHGSKHASGATLLRAIGAKTAIISCATNNDYGHPHLATLKRLSAAGMALHRTDLEGDITLDSEDGRITVTPARVVPEADEMIPGRTLHEAKEAP